MQPTHSGLRPSAFRDSFLRLAALCASTALVVSVSAASITVNTTADTLAGMTTSSVAALNASSTRSLRGAIIAVNNDPGSGHTINLPAGTYTLAIADLAASAAGGEDLAATGDLDIRKSVTISGAGAASTIIEGGTTSSNGIDKLISVNPAGNGGATAVTISGVTLRNGRNQVTNPDAYNNVGGAMDYDSMGAGTLTLNNVVFANNATTNGEGGALALFSGGTVTITNCTFSGNTARSNSGIGAGGGALFIGDNYGTATTVTLTSCVFDGNKTFGTVVGSGGAILSSPTGAEARLVLHGCTVTNNRTGDAGQTVSGDGGGICTSTLTIDQGSVVTGNVAARFGGGVYVVGGTTGVAGSTLVGNSTRSGSGAGGAVYVNRSTTTISNCRIAGNTASVGSAVATNSANGAAASATNNWWGTNTPAASLFGSGVASSPYLQLTITASPTSVAASLGTSAVTAKITTNSSGSTGFSVPSGTPVSFGGLLGSLSPTATTLASGVATSVFTAGALGGSGNATATVDGQVVSAPITVIAPFRTWQVQNFGGNADNAAIAGEAADPDRDGLNNLIEYALGLDPNAFTATSIVVDATTGALRLTVPKNAAATDITYLVEVSGDLVAWTNSGTTVDTNTPSLLRVLDNTPLSGATRRFIRLKVTKP